MFFINQLAFFAVELNIIKYLKKKGKLFLVPLLGVHRRAPTLINQSLHMHLPSLNWH